MTERYHEPVLVEEVLRYLEPRRGGLYFDGTLGGGGHSEAILEADPEARVVAADRDPEALAEAERRLGGYGDRFRARRGDFAEVAEGLEEALAGALLDLGVSSHQIDALERGFTFRAGAPLDMRMGEAGRTAAEVLNRYGEEELVRVLREYGEERRAWPLVRRIVARRSTSPFETSEDLVEVLEEVYRHRLTPQDKARVFQALRIEVNDELASLDRALPVLRERLEGSGVLVVIAYHSLEDRRVKNAFREWSRACVCPPELPVCQCRGEPLGETLTRKVVRPGASEVERNVRSRSARLRAWRKAT
ncbi:MAG: 16S rRNA (cytosine(1402)-N(4))-methyltransferase RsmH [Gemmatimonadetes bacterium]|nr:16S rRNA (cytosine(1402)-N(4))-methyltransferase RsmH [Gemmatimonadota bacterium]NIQ58166.1 16S rRNA (cytosine(1402)-N(4))-methyltransferase RsmH [Gemmatimonadota bacterium]NIU78372.1 16S rRNA (cytosine(1402)-N(4))-methyltransferase RsmH [Gammaproteobacteria bacterium]NIX47304.1 16S rRNA (cytosine(1402)-N(4))-methyltransferase RsmH [Gemmatimonadota bacterium]NIY11677.1 16S rRNA (cytosine(1402)-N(4))-methyltransferase RsmH [Gemmatimonadota bacterium]